MNKSVMKLVQIIWWTIIIIGACIVLGSCDWMKRDVAVVGKAVVERKWVSGVTHRGCFQIRILVSGEETLCESKEVLFNLVSVGDTIIVKTYGPNEYFYDNEK